MAVYDLLCNDCKSRLDMIDKIMDLLETGRKVKERPVMDENDWKNSMTMIGCHLGALLSGDIDEEEGEDEEEEDDTDWETA